MSGKRLPVVGSEFSPITFRTAFKIIDNRFDGFNSEFVEIRANIKDILAESAGSLGGLSDVNVVGVADAQVLIFQASTGKWVPATISGGAGGGGAGGAAPLASEIVAGLIEIATLDEVNSGAVDLAVTADKFVDATVDGGTF